ncbi:MAG: alpha/beta hydrolase [Polyangiaceae bacterium]
MHAVEMGGLRVHVTGGTDRDGGVEGPVVVLLHGFGAPGEDLVSLHRVLAAPAGTRVLFPEAPISLAGMGFGDGRAWWMIDVERLMAIQMGRRGDAEKLRAEVPAGLSSAREKVLAMLGDVEKTMKPSHLVLGGFSQGAMLSCDVALRSGVRLDGVVLMSGTLIAEAEWAPLFAKRAGLQAFQSHGQEDALLPFSNAERLRDRMTQAGWNVSWVAFRGGHEIPGLVLDGLSAFLGRTLA